MVFRQQHVADREQFRLEGVSQRLRPVQRDSQKYGLLPYEARGVFQMEPPGLSGTVVIDQRERRSTLVGRSVAPFSQTDPEADPALPVTGRPGGVVDGPGIAVAVHVPVDVQDRMIAAAADLRGLLGPPLDDHLHRPYSALGNSAARGTSLTGSIVGMSFRV